MKALEEKQRFDYIDAIDLVRDKFREELGVEINISLNAHSTRNNDWSQEDAEAIADTIGDRAGIEVEHGNISRKKDTGWSCINNEKKRINYTVFYQKKGC